MPVGLPKQIQAQLDAAEQIEKQLAGEAPEQPVETPEPPIEHPEPEPQPTPPVATPPVQPAEDSYRARYETLQGKYSAEVPKLYEALRERDNQLAELQQRLATQSTKPAAEPKAEQLVTSQDEDRFGSDLVEFARRAVREGMAPIESRLQTLEQYARQIAGKAERVDAVAQEVAVSREKDFWTSLAAEVPDWEQINADQRWIQWLLDVDPVAGKQRQKALEEAQAAFDSKRVVALFNLFKAQFAVPRQPQRDPKAELARQVAPAKSSTATVHPQATKTYSGDEYKYWTDHRRIHDTPKEQLGQMLQEMEIALHEGRVKF